MTHPAAAPLRALLDEREATVEAQIPMVRRLLS
jgi:hypothetical protein